MSYPFSVEFNIFYKNMVIDKKAIDIMNKLKTGFHTKDSILKRIISYSVENLGTKYKLFDRLEPSISSIDEKKQLRLAIDIDKLKYNNSIYFNQTGSEYFTIEELKDISQKVKEELEEYLRFEIFEPIIYIETNRV
jgi:hypothetical protein